MLKYCLKKVGQVAIVMLLISFFSFAIIDLAPGDISSMYLTEDMSRKKNRLSLKNWDSIRVCPSSIGHG